MKTINFRHYNYIGDPVNTARIFNELEVDELALLDITATREGREPQFEILREVADECFMPLAYGGGINHPRQVEQILKLGFEKIVIGTSALKNTDLIRQVASQFGSQAIVIAIDVKKNFWGKYEVWSNSGTVNEKRHPVDWAKEVEQCGAGEILLTAIDREGTWSGFDITLTRQVSESIHIPVIAHGGAGSIQDIEQAITEGKASATALGSMVVFQKKGHGVLVNFPDRITLEKALNHLK